ncbi:MAG: UDP-N-acetylmuramoyl-L-alanine--D-glutamate ligase [Hydrogenophaga sp.]|nr:UDP-N-acetylmuramoyl-L-alanine--D-glutamate ligase [Hydrogenophaga sp.]
MNTSPHAPHAVSSLPPEGVPPGLGRPGVAALPTSLQDRHVLVLGLGASGLAMACWCARLGAQVTVIDTRENPPQAAALAEAVPGARLLSGALEASLMDGATYALVARSPGLAPSQWQPLADAASAIGIPVVGELDLFAHALNVMGQDTERPYRPHVLAITGTNGKTTVTSLTGLLLERAGVRVAVAGNIGPSMLDQLGQALDAEASCDADEPVGALPQTWVLELSSFQLHGVSDFEPTAATILNITQDHLDWHGDMAAYAADKVRIFGNHGLMLLNRQDARVMALRPQPVTQREGKTTRTLPARAHALFGTDLPTRPGDWGIEEVNGMAWLVRALAVDETRKPKRGESAEIEVYLQRLMPAEALRIRGRHNASNALAALALASATGAPLGPMLHGLREYQGEPHRVEPVAIVHEVEYFDDSKGTNVGATLAAINGLGAERRLVVILGGDGKGQDFSPLADAVARHVRAVVLIGRDAGLIREALTATGVPLLNADTLEAATNLAAQHAQPSDAVLLSPACASLDMFRNYGHRAEVFVAAVQALALEAGELL